MSQRVPTLKGSNPVQNLKTGQIIQGQILKLYPGNKAEIQIGLHKLIAQLETSLTLGSRYHFQVQTTDGVVHLRVLGAQLLKSMNYSGSDLLKRLGFKANKEHAALLNALMTDNIPFTVNQLKRTFSLLDEFSEQDGMRYVLKEMIAANLPLTRSVFQAMASLNQNAFSDQLHILKNMLTQKTNLTTSEKKLLNVINQLIGSPFNTGDTLSHEILAEIREEKPYVFNALKLTGMIEQDMDFLNWKKHWKAANTQMSFAGSKVDQPAIRHTLLAGKHLQVWNAFKQLVQHQSKLTEQAKVFESTFSRHIDHAITHNRSLHPETYQRFSQWMSESMMPLFPQLESTPAMRLPKNNPASLKDIMQMMSLIQDDGVYKTVRHVLAGMQLEKHFLSSTIQNKFLIHLQNVINKTSLTYESQVWQDTVQQLENTLKAMLIKLIQSSENDVSDQSNRLLNIINGLQIQSVAESNQFIHAHLEIPGEKLGLTNNIELHFEGGKKNGKIDPDFCRIHFYLELAHLKETVIDMHIQKRSVMLTIYNDSVTLKKVSIPFEVKLKKGLETLNYQLSSIVYKPLESEENILQDKSKPAYNLYHEGVDYRI